MKGNVMNISNLWNELYGEQNLIEKLLMNENVLNAIKPRPIVPVTIERVDDKTVVLWNDGSSTSVTLSNGDRDDLYTAFCAAYTKKMFGTNSCIRRTIQNADKNKFKTELMKAYKTRYEKIDADAKKAIRKILKNARKKNKNEMNKVYSTLNTINKAREAASK